MIVTCEQMQQAEERLFSTGVIAEDLMEKAGLGCCEAIRQFFPKPAKATLYLGKGNNGGDALVVGRELRRHGWTVSAVKSGEPAEMTDLAAKKLAEFEAVGEDTVSGAEYRGASIVVDGLLGIGARGPMRGIIGERAEQLNRQRLQDNAICFAIDIPSGVDGDQGTPYEGAVVADFTLSIAEVKAGLVQEAAINHVGRIVQIPLPELVVTEAEDDFDVLCASHLSGFVPRRNFDCHKGHAGRVGILAGSRGYTGAAILASSAAVHAGAGLVTLYADESIYEILAAKAVPEVMVKPIQSLAEIREDAAEVLAVGPGIGMDPPLELLDLILNDSRPMVLDADGLNLIARSEGAMKKLAVNNPPRLLTPHPGEMARLSPDSSACADRFETVDHFIQQNSSQCVLLYKGARTLIAAEGKAVAINSTGNPGMATGGVGDVLTGVCAALTAQGLSLYDAASVGSWLIGRSAERWIFECQGSPESLSAGVIIDLLDFEGLRRGIY